MITPEQVGLLTDEQIAETLTFQTQAIVLLMHKLGDEVTFTDEELSSVERMGTLVVQKTFSPPGRLVKLIP